MSTPPSGLPALVVRLVPFFPHWCAEWLATLAQERGNLQIGDLEPHLSERDLRAQICDFSAGDRLSREHAHGRRE